MGSIEKPAKATAENQQELQAVYVIANGFVQFRQSITAAAAALALGVAYKHWRIWSDAGSSRVHLRFSADGSAATTEYPSLESDGSAQRDFATAQKCSMIGVTASGVVNILAWN